MTKKDLLKKIDGLEGRAFYTQEMCLPMKANQAALHRHLMQLARMGKVHLIKKSVLHESALWCGLPEPVGFTSDQKQVRFGLRLDK